MQRTIDSEKTPALNGLGGMTPLAGEIPAKSLAGFRDHLGSLILLGTDAVLAVAVWEIAALFRQIVGRGGISEMSVAAVASSLGVWIGVRWLLGLYPGYGMGQIEELRRQTHAVLATMAITAIFAFSFQVGDTISRLLLLAGFAGLAILAPPVRHLTKLSLRKAKLWGKPVVVLGFGDDGGRVLRVLQEDWTLGLKPVGVFDGKQAPVSGEIEGVPYCGTLMDAMVYGRKLRVDTAIFAMPHTRREHLVRLVERARTSFRQVIIIPNLEGVTNSAVVARDLAGIFGVEVRHNLLDRWSQRVKRTIDVTVTVVGGVLLLPLFAVLCLLILLESGRPVFYRAERMGRDGRSFGCLKFRTMIHGAEDALERLLRENEDLRREYELYHKLREDPRVTRVGKLLRTTSLDELPQLWNVLKGEMSLVGPRPYLPRESPDMGEAEKTILRVTPGITGPWQVGGRSGTSFKERVRMDLYYINNWSIWLDLLLLARTFRSVLFDHGAY